MVYSAWNSAGVIYLSKSIKQTMDVFIQSLCKLFMNTMHLLRLGPPGASSAGGILVPMAPIGGRDEWIVCPDGCLKGSELTILL